MHIPFLKVSTSLVLGFALLCSTSPAYALFFDVPDDHPYVDAIDYLTRNDIVKGYENRSFRPENAINRAEFTKILLSVLFPEKYIDDCIDTLSKNTNPVLPKLRFPDVPHDAWFAKSVCAAWVNGIVSGYPDGKFYPEEGVTFAAAAKMLSLGFGLTGVELPELGMNNAYWYTPYVEILAANRAIPPSINSMNQPINRGEMAEMIYRLKDTPLGSAPINTISKTADEVIYPVSWKEYRNDNYDIAFQYSSVWDAPSVFPRGSYDGRSPYVPSDWTIYFGPKVENCLGSNTCVQRDIWIDGYSIDTATAILDAIENDVYFINVENETVTNGMPTLVVLEEIGKCIDRRAFLFGKKWVYVLNIQCGGQDDTLYHLFDSLLPKIKEIAGKPQEYRK